MQGNAVSINDTLRKTGVYSLAKILADEARFIKAWFGNPSVTGAISPSGRSLARYMAAQVDISLPGPVIELGPGTGPVTQALLERGVDEDRLVLVEYDSNFCALLAARFPRATVVQGDAYDLPKTLAGHLCSPCAAIVSSLPLLLKDEEHRLAMLGHAFDIMLPGAPFIQFTYGLKSPVPRGAELSGKRFSAHRSAPIWLNLPPAHVWVYALLDETAATAMHKPDILDILGAKSLHMRRKLRVAGARMRAGLARQVKKAQSAASKLKR